MTSDKSEFAEYIAGIIAESLDRHGDNSDVTGINDLGPLTECNVRGNKITMLFETDNVSTVITTKVTEVHQTTEQQPVFVNHPDE